MSRQLNTAFHRIPCRHSAIKEPKGGLRAQPARALDQTIQEAYEAKSVALRAVPAELYHQGPPLKECGYGRRIGALQAA
jgi:hypothetical protein